MRLLPAALFTLTTFGTVLAAAQQQSPEMRAFQTCSFPDGLQVMDVAPMPAEVHERPVQVHGTSATVPLVGGERVVFGYGGVPYANVKVEQLPAANFAANRQLLLADFSDIVASDTTVARNSARKPTQNGFSMVGLDRVNLEGSTLGIYLLIDDATRTAATMYLLNAEPGKRRFKTLDESAHLRDTFLYNYTRCVRNNLTGNTFGAPR